MATLTRSTTINAPVDTVLDLALDIGQLWKAKDVALADVDIKPEGVGTSARLYSHLFGFHGRAVSSTSRSSLVSASSRGPTGSQRSRRGVHV